MKEVTEEKLEKYFKVTEAALKKVKIKVPNNIDLKKAAEDFLDMAQRYFEDAKHFKEKGDYNNNTGGMRSRYGNSGPDYKENQKIRAYPMVTPRQHSSGLNKEQADRKTYIQGVGFYHSLALTVVGWFVFKSRRNKK